MQKSKKRELVKRGSELKPTVHIGKEGLNEGVVEEIRKQIKDHGLVKVKILPAASLDKDEVAMELSIATGARVVETRGFTILLCDEKLIS